MAHHEPFTYSVTLKFLGKGINVSNSENPEASKQAGTREMHSFSGQNQALKEFWVI